MSAVLDLPSHPPNPTPRSQPVARQVGFLMERLKLKREQIIVRAPDAPGFRRQLQDALKACGRSEEGYDIVLEALGGM